MRFFADGPDIPESLLDARNLGEVVFFCGAGLSAPVGLPDFAGLADDVIRRLAAQESREARERGESLDRVFTAMVKEFGGAAVDLEMSRALRTPRNADLRFHRAILDLSRGTDGAAKVVTTNFDLLFERVDRTLRRYVPPALPDLAQLQPVQGIVYLHGRLNRSAGARAGYVISSADFGRAYLAEGWAARFVRGLRERYTIVLVGYSANDPPMRYLLEGLNSREGSSYRTLIYAFAPEGAAAADEAWRDKGVTTIPYSPRDAAHAGLWDTLFAWAEAARDPAARQTQLISLAQSQPASLHPFERGQVAHLVSSKAGAREFSAARPLPPAEWLCVFDAGIRYSKPGRLNWQEEIEVDPLDVFGLDNDPPRPEPRPGGEIDVTGEDLIRWRNGDESRPDRQRLSGFHPLFAIDFPPRLFHLASWLAEVMDQPAALWWAARNTMPHPGLVREVRNRLDRAATMPPPVRSFWQCWLEACRARTEYMHDLRRYELAARVRSDGWSNAVLRELERVIEPFFEIKPASLSSPIPPAGDWNTLNLRHVVDIRVAVSNWPADGGLEPPSDILAAVATMVRRSLVRMAEMLTESTVLYWRTPTLHPTGERGESQFSGRKAGHFLKFKALFERLVLEDAAAARREVQQWDSNDPIFFAKLFLFSATLLPVVDHKDVASRLLAMPAEVFWDSNLARELLFALRANWPHFSPATLARLEHRIASGPPIRDGESRKDHRRRASAHAASWLRWLELHGRTLTGRTQSKLQKLMAADSRWSGAWAWNADDSGGPWGGYIERVKESQGLEDAPLPNVLALAEALSTDDHRQLRDYRPFDGLVEKAPFRALAALRIASRRGEHPPRFWHSIVDNWPSEATTSCLSLFFGFTLARLPAEMFKALRHGVADWLSKNLDWLLKSDRARTLKLWDVIVARYAAADAATLESGVGFSTIGGVPQEKSEFSLMKAINSPAGKLAGALLKLPGDRKRKAAMPAWIATRLDRLLQLPGDGGGHAACVIARQLSWLEYWFPTWAAKMLPMLALDHPLAEAMWHGLAADQHFLSDEARRSIKPALLDLLVDNAPFQMDREERERLIQWMTMLTMPRGGNKAVVSYADVRSILMNVGDTDRAEALELLARSMDSGEMWTGFVRPFILDAWPRQLRFQSEASARQFAYIAEKAGDRFPEVVELVLPFLRPVAHFDTFAYRLKKQDEDGQGYSARFPADTLRLLDAVVGDDPQLKPWNLGELIETIAEAQPALRQSDQWRRLKGIAQ
ncbi:SIR2 family protein [Sphingosinithalassobacter portus]|uniref:SIR2 family protein n=1 Tax=Stakelama portus TaxID=2676234 RepID=UPI000D6DE014|nr:SIR2 family protein [Sphingosinithalassobacter portus]